jgi:peptidoglycan/LPS O-acetylase OafA/YrhL
MSLGEAAMSGSVRRIQHFKSLDGIRGIAVSLVVLFHFGLFPAGWIGVQVFFVLSGYLITGILLREKERPFSEYIGRFYWRRSLRIFPLYFVFLAAVAAVYFMTGKPISFAIDWPFLTSYTTNFGRLREADIGRAMVHLWSLAVEEQFYLLWPFLVFFMPMTVFKRTALLIIALSPLVRLGLFINFQGHDQEWIGRNIYCLPISQFDAFAAGAAISIWRLESLPSAWKWFLGVAGLTALCGIGVLAHEHFLYKNAIKWTLGYSMFLLPAGGFVWAYSLLNFLSAGIIICSMQRLSAFRILEATPLVRLGQISYGVYVFHLPMLFALGTLDLSNGGLFASYLFGPVLIAEISFRFLETPFLRMKDRSVALRVASG